MGRGHQGGSLGQLGDRVLTAVGGEKKLQCSVFDKLFSLRIFKFGQGGISGTSLGGSGA